jgi:2,3,4,5-tetrahydropyridine-2,6-dicarboxylate N-succinyltransferase
MQAGPTIIEDNCFIGARSEVVEGCIVREGSVLGMGVFIGKSTKIVDRETGRRHVWRSSLRIGRSGRFHAVEGRHQPLLCRDREEGRCADPVQDVYKRTSA